MRTEHQQKILEAALHLSAKGFSIIPVSKDKRPLVPWKQYQTAHASPQQIEEWVDQFPELNIGAATGAISGIVVVDIEKGGSTEGFPPTVAVMTGGGGWHLYYKHPGNPISNSVRKLLLTDIRGDGGYVVLPPSVHASGNRYEWSLSPDDADFAEFPAVIFEDAPKDKQEVGEDKSAVVAVGQRNDDATRFVGSVLHYLPPELWEAVAWPAAKHRNQTQYQVPLEETELRATFESIRAREVMQRMKEPAVTLKLEPVTLTRLLKEQFPAPQWLATNLIPLGGVTGFTGMPNSYKTFLTQSLAISVATGTPFLGHFPTAKGRVLIIDEENQRRQVRQRFDSMGTAPTDDILILSQQGIRLDNDKQVERLREILDRERISLVVLDSLVRFHRGEENSAKDMSLLLAGVRKLASNERSVLFIHHHRKQYGGEGQNRDAGQNIRGSSDILAAVDCHISIDRSRNGGEFRIVQTKLRLQPELRPFTASLVPLESGSIGFAYQGEDDKEERQKLEDQDSIRFALTGTTDPKSINQLAEELEITKTRVRMALKELRQSKEVTIARTGEHNEQFYALTTPEVGEEKQL